MFRVSKKAAEYIKAQIVVPDETSSQGYKRLTSTIVFRVYKTNVSVDGWKLRAQILS